MGHIYKNNTDFGCIRPRTEGEIGVSSNETRFVFRTEVKRVCKTRGRVGSYKHRRKERQTLQGRSLPVYPPSKKNSKS